jgi:hypothetical protein
MDLEILNYTLLGTATVTIVAVLGYLIHKINRHFWYCLILFMAALFLGGAAVVLVLYTLTIIGAAVSVIIGGFF